MSQTPLSRMDLASRRARREQADQEPVWDVWLVASLLAGLLLVVGGFMQAGFVGALAGLVFGAVLVGLSVGHNPAARLRMAAVVQAKLAANRNRGAADRP